jgi:hypothetical protein
LQYDCIVNAFFGGDHSAGRATIEGMLVTIARADRGSTVATIQRRDGVVVELPGYDRKFRVPHDLAHAVTERGLGLSRGVFGSIAGGGMVGNMRVLTGRPRHDAAERSRRPGTARTARLAARWGRDRSESRLSAVRL